MNTLPFIDPVEAGKNLERLMRDKNISQKQLAQETEIQQEAISRAVKTGRGLSFRRWKRIAHVLDVPPENIFGFQKLPTT